jgi:putative ABC transport system substrate-binding protein
MRDLNRRGVIGLVGGAAAWPLPARAQQRERMRRIGVLMGVSEDDADAGVRIAAFQERLERYGWNPGGNLRIDYRWSAGDPDKARAAAVELVALAPEVIIADGTPALRAVRQVANSTAIVFTVVSEPVAAGFVQSLANPGGNITGFSNLEPTVGGKWVELLKEMAPRVSRAALMFNPDTAPLSQQSPEWAQSVGARLAVTASTIPVRTPDEIKAALSALGRQPNNGLILPQDPFTSVHRQLIVDLAARNNLPSIYAFRYFVVSGGLASYGIDVIDQYRLAASYTDRILRGTKPADLPVQQPTKFELVINLKTAKALSLDVPPTLLARADEVIE